MDIGLLFEVPVSFRPVSPVACCFNVFDRLSSSSAQSIGSEGDSLLCEMARCLGDDVDEVKSTLCGFLRLVLLFDLLFPFLEKYFSRDPLDD